MSLGLNVNSVALNSVKVLGDKMDSCSHGCPYGVCIIPECEHYCGRKSDNNDKDTSSADYLKRKIEQLEMFLSRDEHKIRNMDQKIEEAIESAVSDLKNQNSLLQNQDSMLQKFDSVLGALEARISGLEERGPVAAEQVGDHRVEYVTASEARLLNIENKLLSLSDEVQNLVDRVRRMDSGTGNVVSLAELQPVTAKQITFEMRIERLEELLDVKEEETDKHSFVIELEIPIGSTSSEMEEYIRNRLRDVNVFKVFQVEKRDKCDDS
jgi:hypothetical protein